MPTALIITLTLYAVASPATFVAYALDKRAARTGRRRIRERTLHQLELAGGWPGALLAQRLLRHKNRDRRFLTIFTLIVLLHAAAWTTVILLTMQT